MKDVAGFKTKAALAYYSLQPSPDVSCMTYVLEEEAGVMPAHRPTSVSILSQYDNIGYPSRLGGV